MDLFSTFPRQQLANDLRALADRGVFLGTSSWKYPGWIGLLYDEQRYLYQGRFAKSRFERDCLREYAEVFPTVCVDARYYQFPTESQVARLCDQVPDGFRFSYKVTEEITVRRFSNLPRYGDRRGRDNPNFLNPDSFRLNFLRPLEPHREKIGLLIFEFSRFKAGDFGAGRQFVQQLDQFFSQLPKGWQYGVEVRNPSLLHPDYFSMLQCHGVTHVFSSWERMPPLEAQLKLDGCRTAPFAGARLLLKPGRKYKEAVDSFAPYDQIHEELPEVRQGAVSLLSELASKASPSEIRAENSYLYVNNRLEGNSLYTILGILAGLSRKENDKNATLE